MTSRPSLGHVHLEVTDLDRSIDFYCTHLALEVTERTGPFAFLSWGDRHHDLALQEIDGVPNPSNGVGLYHVAFEVETEAVLASIYRGLRDDGVPVSPVDHGISKALYVSDPDGIGVEIYVDTRSSLDQRWGGRSKRFDPETARVED